MYVPMYVYTSNTCHTYKVQMHFSSISNQHHQHHGFESGQGGGLQLTTLASIHGENPLEVARATALAPSRISPAVEDFSD